MTLKRRVMVALVALVTLFTLIQGGLAVYSMHEQEDDLVDDLVLTEARRLGQRIDHNGPDILVGDEAVLLPQGYEAWWTDAQGRTVPGPLPSTLAPLAEGPHRDLAEGSEYHIVVLGTAGGRLTMRYDAERNEEKVHDYAVQVLLLALLFIALSVLIARYVAGVLVAPIEKVTRLLDHWAPAAEPAASSATATDEESRLLDAFRRVQARWETGLARQSEVLADLRHEVRTPLTALRTDLEMLGHTLGHDVAASTLAGPAGTEASAGRPSPPSDDAVRRRLQRALASVDAVASALASVRALASGRTAPAERVPLADCVDDAWASLGELPASRGLLLLNQIDPQAGAVADRHALMTILGNLIRNAVDHAAPAECRVMLEGQTLVIEDNGPGIPPDELPFVFERYYRGRLADAPSQPAPDSGATGGDYPRGLGLAIARQVAEMHGWALAVAPAPPRGSRFTLTLGETSLR